MNQLVYSAIAVATIELLKSLVFWAKRIAAFILQLNMIAWALNVDDPPD